MHAPTDCHMECVKRILRYLKGTVGDGLRYIPDGDYISGHRLITYSDADWAGDLMNTGQFQDTVFSFDRMLLHGVARNKRLLLNPAPRQNTGL